MLTEFYQSCNHLKVPLEMEEVLEFRILQLGDYFSVIGQTARILSQTFLIF